MPVYQYSALDQVQHRVAGRMMARDESELEQQLLGLNQYLIAASIVKAQHTDIRLSDLQRAWICFQLEQLLMSGLNIQFALRELAQTKNKTLSRIFQQLLVDIEYGNSLSGAMSKLAKVFDRIAVSVVQAGEKSGELSAVFSQLGRRYQWQHQVKKQCQKILIYPLITLSVVMLTSLFLMIFLVPQLAQFLHELKQDLPWITRQILALSNFLNSLTIQHLSWLIPIAIFLRYVLSRVRVLKTFLHQITLKLPFFGEIYKKILILRMLKCFLLLQRNTVSLHESILICSHVMDNAVMAEKLANITRQIEYGYPLSSAFEQQKIFPEILIRMLRMGEQTGEWQHGLLKLVELYEAEVDAAINQLIQLSEPVMTLILGLLLSVVMMGILSPIYQSFEHFGF